MRTPGGRAAPTPRTSLARRPLPAGFGGLAVGRISRVLRSAWGEASLFLGGGKVGEACLLVVTTIGSPIACVLAVADTPRGNRTSPTPCGIGGRPGINPAFTAGDAGGG
jgi:hypothetical protein